jgi:glycosyltransferase involved in cell wall biosynthesis
MSKNNSLVAVSMITFNHEQFIANAIESVLMQETNFPFKLFITDDHSIDSTASICLDYAKRYPEKIFFEKLEHNKGSMGNWLYNLNLCVKSDSEFIAICEGDDFWTDSSKLQKQVNFLKNKKDFSLVCHKAIHINVLTNEKSYNPKQIKGNIKLSSIILKGGGLITTNSIMFRSKNFKHPPAWLINSPVGDLPLVLLNAHIGKVFLIDKIMSAYNYLTPSSWSQAMNNKVLEKKKSKEMSEMWKEFNKWSDYNYFFFISVKLVIDKLYYLKKRFFVK